MSNTPSTVQQLRDFVMSWRRPAVFRNRREHMRNTLGLWLAEHELSNQLEEALPVYRTESAGDVHAADGIRPFHTDVQEGDIRVADPNLSDSGLPLYFCVAKVTKGGSVLVVPFSSHSTPAVLGEMWSMAPGEYQHFSLRVLQGWNVIMSTKEIVGRSWCEFTDIKIAHRARSSFRHIIGHPLPEEYKNDTGVPIRRSDDPRHTYQTKEVETWTKFRMQSF